MPAADVRLLAHAILDSFGDRFKPLRGDNYYVDSVADPRDGFSNFTIEVFPKQDTVREDGFGNLMRLPMGRNLKAPQSKTFFLDQSVARPPIKPHADPVTLLTDGNPWA